MPDDLLTQEAIDALLAAASSAPQPAAEPEVPVAGRSAAPQTRDRTPLDGSATGTAAHGGAALESMVRGLDVGLDVVLGEVELPIRDILHLGSGSLVVTDRTLDAPVELRLSGRTVALGEIVVVDDGYALRVTRNLLRPAS